MTWNKCVFHDYGNSCTLISHLKSVINKIKTIWYKIFKYMLNQAKRRQLFYKKALFIYSVENDSLQNEVRQILLHWGKMKNEWRKKKRSSSITNQNGRWASPGRLNLSALSSSCKRWDSLDWKRKKTKYCFLHWCILSRRHRNDTREYLILSRPSV